MIISNNSFSSIEQMAHKLGAPTAKERVNESSDKRSFQEILLQQRQSIGQRQIKFSKHATERLSKRNISLSKAQLSRLEDGTQMARAKGVKESLVCVDDLAFIVNVTNNTVVTAMNQENEKVFTNIDGAVIV